MAGIAGEVVLESIAWAIAPVVLGRPMEPALLVSALGNTLFGMSIGTAAAFAIHLGAGVVIFPLGYLLFRAATRLSWAEAGILWGVVLWFIAQGLLAPLAGRPFMLGFGTYTWASLLTHVIYMLTVALAYERLARRVAVRGDAPLRHFL
jgi:hypothetical protein